MSYEQVRQGKLLVADPYLYDPNFKRSVILMTGHSHEEGSIGFILNKPLRMDVENLLSDFPEFESQVYYGGPVSTETIHFIHTAGKILDDSQSLGRGLFWGGNYEQLKFLISNGLIKSSDIRFYVGYAGWSPGQLQSEMDAGSWVVAENDLNYIFNTHSKRLWKNVLSNKGEHFAVIAEMPDEFILN